MEGCILSSCHIRVSEETKRKLDNIRYGETVEGKYGYRKKMQYNDLIKQMLNNDYFESQDRINFAMIQHICSHVLNPVQYDSPHVLIQHVIDYLKLYVATSRDNKGVAIYNDVISYLTKTINQFKDDW